MPRKKKVDTPAVVDVPVTAVTEVIESHGEQKSDGTLTPGKNPRGFVLEVTNYIPEGKLDPSKDYKFGGRHETQIARNKSGGWEVGRDHNDKTVTVGGMTMLVRPKDKGDSEREFKREETARLVRRYKAEKVAEAMGEAGFGKETRKAWF